jgi:hypothetical protein
MKIGLPNFVEARLIMPNLSTYEGFMDLEQGILAEVIRPTPNYPGSYMKWILSISPLKR